MYRTSLSLWAISFRLSSRLKVHQIPPVLDAVHQRQGGLDISHDAELVHNPFPKASVVPSWQMLEHVRIPMDA